MARRKHEERFSAERYMDRKKKCEAFFNFLQKPRAREIQEKLCLIMDYDDLKAGEKTA